MSDPTRWKDTEGPQVAMLLEAMSKVEPTAEARENVWLKVAATLPPGPGSSSDPSQGGGTPGSEAPPAPPAPSAAGLGVGAKVLGVTIAIAGAGALAFVLSAREPVAPSTITTPKAASASASAAEAAPLPAEVAVATSGSAAPVVSAAPRDRPVTAASSTGRSSVRSQPSAAAPAASARPVSADGLREEAEGVRTARRLLREKHAAAALAELERLGRRFPAGPLEEEREVLTIEAMAASGNVEGARRRAERFLFERPQSVHASRVRSIGVPPQEQAR